MGQRTTYYQSKHGKSLEQHLIQDYVLFRNWILNEHRCSIEEFNERMVSVNFEVFLKEVTCLSNFKNLKQEILDELTFEYLLTYCGYEEGEDTFEIVGPMMNTKRYDSSSEYVASSSDFELKSIWSAFVDGRSTKNGKGFISPEVNHKIGFWSPQDQAVLLQKFTELRKTNLKIEGFEYVVSVLEEVKGRNLEIIIDSEK